MSVLDDIKKRVAETFRDGWDTSDGRVVPDTTSIAMGNAGVNLDATVLYADLAESTALVDTYSATFAAEVYKTYLYGCARLVTSLDGVITAYDGDRVMAVYLGKRKNTNAVRTALAINHVVVKVIGPALATYAPSYVLKQSVGIDTGKLLVARTGMRQDNDLVWVGRAANYAAKLCSIREGNFASWITGGVYDAMLNEVKTSSDGRPMWEERKWTAMGGLRIYRSGWFWSA